MKYILVAIKAMKQKDKAFVNPIIFPDNLSHNDVYKAMLVAWGKEHGPHRIIHLLSAGTIDLFPRIQTYGFSRSLGIKAHSDDARMIQELAHKSVYYLSDLIETHRECRL